MDEDALTKGQPLTRTDPASFPSQAEPVPIPDHQLLKCIGRGSYGEVWLARNMMGVYRAVKIVYRKSFQDQRPFERELSDIRKFEPISRSYDGFVDVLHVGINEEQGYFYYVMELADDQTSGQAVNPEIYSPRTLAKELSLDGKLPLQECLQLGLALSQALAELHKHGLVHRDVKPSNIIFVNGVPKLADIGLVADAGQARSYVGTEGFIPPEGPGTHQADVYGLGKVLYECCTGKDRQDFPELPTLLDQFPDYERLLELNEVILHACKNGANERYRSAWDMHADLLVVANGKSVKRLRLLEKRLSFLKRAASISALALIALGTIAYQIYREWRGIIESRQRQVGANVAYGNRAVESGDLSAALPYFAEALRLSEQTLNQDSANHRLQLGSGLAQSVKLTHMWFESGRIDDAGFSPDGKTILITEYYGQPRIYDLQSGKLLSHQFGSMSGLARAAFSPDGRFVITASEANSARVWDTVNLEERLLLPHSNKVFCARFSPDGLRIVTACKDGLARLWSVPTGQLERSLEKHADAVLFADFSNNGKLIVTTSYDNTARIWDATTGQETSPPLVHGSWVTYAAFSPDDQTMVTTSLDRKARVWEVATGKRIPPDLNHGDGVKSAEYSPDGRLIVTASLDGTARLWEADTLRPLRSNPILRHGERLTRASFSADGRRILTACVDGIVRIWDLAGSAVPPEPVTHSFSQDGSRYLTATTNGIRVWNGASGQPVSPLIAANWPLEKANLNRNGTFAVTVSERRTESDEGKRLLQTWEVGSGKRVGTGISLSNPATRFKLNDDGSRLVTFDGKNILSWDVPAGTVCSLAVSGRQTGDSVYLSRDGKRIAARCGAEVQVWEAETGQTSFPLLRHIARVGYLEFSPDGSRLVSCCWDDQFTKCYAQIWSASTGQPVGPQLRHNDGVLFASFSPDGDRVVTAGEDFKAVVWDAVTGRQLASPLLHEEKVRTAAFSPDGKWIVTASSDRTARVWNSDTGDPLTPPLRHLTPLRSAKFVAGGRRIATIDDQGTTRVRELPVDERPVEELIILARLLSGNSVAPAGDVSPPQSMSLENIWRRLRTRHPSTFRTSDEQIMAWHAFQAEESEARQQWSAAIFHLRQLVTIRPGDNSLVERLIRAETEKKAKSSSYR